MSEDERGASLQLGLKNAEVALEHEQRITQNEERTKCALELIDGLEESKADKSKLIEILKDQGWKVFAFISFGIMMAWATGVISAIKAGFGYGGD